MPSGDTLALLVLVGLLLGVAPVAIGLLAYPALRNLGRAGMSLPAGADRRPAPLPLHRHADGGSRGGRARRSAGCAGTTVVFVAAALTALALLAVGRRGGKAPEGSRLAFFIALGIGLHNFGEGLAVGAALATGAAALATFLVVGFVIHNVTEGIGIAAPLIGRGRGLAGLRRPRRARRAARRPRRLARHAGGQPVLDGALLRHRRRRDPAGDHRGVALLARREGPAALTSGASVGGVIAGLLIMYATALLV